MSDTESFEYAIKVMRENLTGMYDNGHMTSWANVDTSVDLELIQKAHDREMEELRKTYDLALAQARDPQRLRGTKPNTFDGATEALREFRWQHATNDEDAIPYINAVKEMHDREIRDTAQREYHRGYEDAMHARATATWQLDQERMEIVRGLREFRCEDIESWFEMQFWTLLRLLGVESNASIPADCDDVAHLRDRLIHLLGGDSNSANSGRCSANNLQNSPKTINLDELTTALNHGKAEIPSITEVSDGRVADDSDGNADSGYRGRDIHFDGVSTYDELGNERQKAVCELRNMHLDTGSAVKKLAIALGVEWNSDNAERSVTLLQKRLIHLLGGDQRSGIDAMREMDAESDNDGTCPDDVGTSSITDELREYIALTWDWDDTPYVKQISMKLRTIACRIDEQFDRFCQQQEAVLQSTIDGAAQRLKDADRRLDEAAHDVEMWRDRSEDMRMERDATLAELNARNDTDAVTQLYRLLKSTLGEAKCIRDRLVAQSDLNHKVKAYADRCRDDCRMYREMLNDAAKEYADLKAERDALCDDFEPDEEDFDQFLRDVLEDL